MLGTAVVPDQRGGGLLSAERRPRRTAPAWPAPGRPPPGPPRRSRARGPARGRRDRAAAGAAPARRPRARRRSSIVLLVTSSGFRPSAVVPTIAPLAAPG